jgi:hypothetical protein
MIWSVMFFYSLHFILNSYFKFLTVWSSVEFVWCWCVPTIRISGSSLLSTHSIYFITSVMYIPSVCISPLPSSFLGTHKRSVHALG